MSNSGGGDASFAADEDYSGGGNSHADYDDRFHDRGRRQCSAYGGVSDPA